MDGLMRYAWLNSSVLRWLQKQVQTCHFFSASIRYAHSVLALLADVNTDLHLLACHIIIIMILFQATRPIKHTSNDIKTQRNEKRRMINREMLNCTKEKHINTSKHTFGRTWSSDLLYCFVQLWTLR